MNNHMNDDNESTTGTEVVRDAAGRWLVPPKGGRPKGQSQATLVRTLIEPHRTELIDKALSIVRDSTSDAHAKIGALRLLLERLAPLPKHDSERIEVPGLQHAETFTEKCQAVIAAVADGTISAEAGERVLRLLDVYRKAVAHDELEQRIKALERGQQARTVEAVAPGSELV